MDGTTGRDVPPTGPGRRLPLVLGGSLATMLLATIGATGGYLLAGEPEQRQQPSAGATPSASGSPPTRSADPSPTARSTPPRTTAPPQVELPNLVGWDFEQARAELRSRGLGWQLTFGSGSGRQVERTKPSAGRVGKGTTVQLYVTGPAPELTVPRLIGERCTVAAAELVDAGFSPRYPMGKSGQVVQQEPEPYETARWNDIVAVSCGSAPPSRLPESSEPTPGGSTD